MSDAGLKVPVGIENAAFKSGLNECREYAKEFSGEVKAMFAETFAVVAVLEGLKSWMESMEKVQHQAEQFGETAETIQRVGHAAKLAGIDFEMLGKTLNKVSIEASKTADGKGLAHQFEIAGIEAKKFSALNMRDQILELTEAWEKANGSQAKQDAIMSILGPRSAEVLKLMAKGTEEVKADMDQCIPVTGGVVKMIENLGRAWDVTKMAAGAVLGFILAGLGSLALTMGLFVGLVTQAVDGAGRDIVTLAVGAGKAFKDALHGNFKAIKDDWKEVMTQMGKNTEAAISDAKPAMDWMKESLRGLWLEKKPERNKGAGLDDGSEAEARKSEEEKLARLREQIAEREKANALALMDYDHKRIELQKELAEAQAKANDTTEEGLESKKKALELSAKLAELEKRHSEEQERERDRHDSDITRAREMESKVDEKNKLDQMTPEQRRAYWLEKQKRLMQESAEADKRGDDVEAVKKRTEAKQINADLLKDEKQKEKQDGKPKVTSSSLAAVGGGGYVAKGSDPLLRAQEKSNALLQRLVQIAEGGTKSTVPASVMKTSKAPTP